MHQYMELVSKIVHTGQTREDRTGTGTISIFGHQMEFDLTAGFPLLTVKKTHWPSIVHELVWMLRGDTTVKYLNEHNVHIWDEWADNLGQLGPIYGAQWRTWEAPDISSSVGVKYIDQIQEVIDEIKNNPWSRRLVVSAWNPNDIPRMALAPCHTLFQFYVRADRQGNPAILDCQLYQRSGDVFLGVPFNIASYALLTHLIAHLTGLKPGKFVHTLGDAHLYLNHMPQVATLQDRWRMESIPPLPQLSIREGLTSIDHLTFDDVKLIGYNPLPGIKAEVAV